MSYERVQCEEDSPTSEYICVNENNSQYKIFK